MKNLRFLSFITIIIMSLPSHLLAQPNQESLSQTTQKADIEETIEALIGAEVNPNLQSNGLDIQDFFLEYAAATASSIISDEILKSSRDFRYEGGVNRLGFRYDTVNDMAERRNFNNMEKLEFLKYLLDGGFVPLPPYINLPDYFVQDNSSNEAFPATKDITRLQEVCRMRDWPCNASPLSFMRLALFSTSFLRESGQTVLSYTDLENLFDTFGYTSEDFTPHDLMVLGQFLRDLHYIPLWPDQSVQRQDYIKDVTDHNFQAEVIDASRDRPVIVYFYASWCPPCYEMTPVIEELAEEFEGDFTLANIYLNGNPKSRTSLSSENIIPSLIFYRDGEKVSEILGIPGMAVSQVLLFELERLKTDREIKHVALKMVIAERIRTLFELEENAGFVGPSTIQVIEMIDDEIF